MDKGVRMYVNAKFLELLPTRTKTREGNTLFRKNVMCSAMEDFGITLAASATHYNHAFIEARKMVAAGTLAPELLENLGRPEDKKGGRKAKAIVAPVQVVEGQYDGIVIQVPNATVATFAVEQVVATEQPAAEQVAVEPTLLLTCNEDVSINRDADPIATEQAAEQQPAVEQVAKGSKKGKRK